MQTIFMLGFSDNFGGYETQMVRLSQELRKLGQRVSIVTSSGFSLKKEKINGVEVIKLPALGGRFFFESSFALPLTLFFLLKKNEKFLLHAHHPAFGGLAVISKLLFRKPLIVKVPASKIFLGGISQWWARLVFNLFKKKVDKFVALNNEIKNELLEYDIPEKNICYIPNGIATKVFRPQKTKKTKNSAIWVGRIHGQKRYDIIIKAWQIIVKNIPDAKLTIFGGNKPNREIFDLVKKTNLKKNITLVFGKRISASDYCKHEVYVSTSAFEGMSNSLLEAMACAMPIVATKIPGVIEIVNDEKEAILADVGNVADTANAIIKLFENKKLAEKLGKNARKKAKNFEIKKIAKKYIELYGSLSEKNE